MVLILSQMGVTCMIDRKQVAMCSAYCEIDSQKCGSKDKADSKEHIANEQICSCWGADCWQEGS